MGGVCGYLSVGLLCPRPDCDHHQLLTPGARRSVQEVAEEWVARASEHVPPRVRRRSAVFEDRAERARELKSSGLTNRAIAERLGVTADTVARYVREAA